MDRIGRSWDLVMKSFGLLLSDKELLVFPVVSAIACLISSIWIFTTFAFFYPEQLSAFSPTAVGRPVLTQEMWGFLFLFYVVNYFIIVFFNVGLVSAASDRLAGGKATVNQGLQVAWRRKGKILQWALLAATVGVLLNVIERRFRTVGRIVADVIGVAWAWATFFVVPLLAAQDIEPVEALQRSASLFRETWGEELVGGFSFGLIFLLLALPGVALPFLLGRNFGPEGAIAGGALLVIYWLMLSAISAAVHGIFMAALYRYATTKEASGPFRIGDFKTAWQPK